MDPVYFPSPSAFREWLEAHHASADELWVGYHKRGTGTPSMTWPESVDEALCFGWIDGLRKSVDAERYAIRFTPRRPGSNWSRVNLARVEALTAEGRMRPAGAAAYEGRKPEADERLQLRGQAAGAARAVRRAPSASATGRLGVLPGAVASYRRLAIGWILAAKREETRLRRLEQIVEASAAGRRWIQGAPKGMTR
jgi:uncharacterized protein YdeI (YjbR/CyaY-like superfamily)